MVHHTMPFLRVLLLPRIVCKCPPCATRSRSCTSNDDASHLIGGYDTSTVYSPIGGVMEIVRYKGPVQSGVLCSPKLGFLCLFLVFPDYSRPNECADGR